ncbi:MAG TPA: glycosyltransferase [Pengzhenrongella sp.]
MTVDPGATVDVLDVDSSYRAVGKERVHSPAAVGVDLPTLHRLALLLEPADLVRALHPPFLRAVLTGATTLVVSPGTILLRSPDGLESRAAETGLCLVARAAGPVPTDGRHPDDADIERAGAWAPGLLALHGDPTTVLDLWERAVASLVARSGGHSSAGDRWLDGLAAAVPHAAVRDPAVLLGPWSLHADQRVASRDDGLLLDGRPVVALDLTGLEPGTPWLLDADARRSPRARLSDHPVLARVVAAHATALVADGAVLQDAGDAPATWDPTTTSLGVPVDDAMRSAVRDAASGGDVAAVPDPFDPAGAGALLAWLTDPSPDGGPGRWLLGVHRTRPDLRAAFPQVPGHDDAGLLAWVRTHGVTDGLAARLVGETLRRTPERPARAGRPRPGVNVIGFLRGELGIGESARLLVDALRAAHVPFRTVPIDRHLTSRQLAHLDGAPARNAEVFDTSIVCVNADLTGAVSASVPSLMDRSYRIGMWYWEVEEFPATQHGGFGALDEVWVATDFVRRAVEPHSPVPVRTITPPLPQRGPAPALTRADLGLPDAPVFLFSFDFLSTAERKNPLGLLDAFRRAFAPGDGPVLVLKSINADQCPGPAEQLRLAAAGQSDVLLIEGYLDAEARDALVALSDCYVSLHRSEGLGLTMAEAMAWGKPVIATGYSGNLQFMTDENSFLVPWTPTQIPTGAEPYPAGGVWAEPDLDAAAAFMRLVVDHPDVAAARGARAAADIAGLHSAAVAGQTVAARLTELEGRRRARSRASVLEKLRRRAAGLRDSVS